MPCACDSDKRGLIRLQMAEDDDDFFATFDLDRCMPPLLTLFAQIKPLAAITKRS